MCDSRSGGDMIGLSPRVRGNRRLDQRPDVLARSIPACAGEPKIVIRIPISIWVYPRVCGGTAKAARCNNCGKGLSPRVRGNPYAAAAGGARRRSIPACAGEPTLDLVCYAARTVYPRVCGGTRCQRRYRARG